MKILITGFKPFNQDEINPTEKILESIDSHYKSNEIYKLLLNVEYKKDANKIQEEIQKIHPDLVIMMGLAGGRNDVCLEKVALNFRHATIKDNAGILISNEKISSNSPIAYETTLNLNKILDSLNINRLSISYSAGTFICNDVYYSTLDYINKNNLNTKALFIHFPYLTEQSKTRPTMELDEMIDILYKVLDLIIFN